MSQPPYPPQGGNDPDGEQAGSQAWNPPDGGDDPTLPFRTPGEGQREQTQQFGQPQYGPPQYGPPQHGPPQHGQPGQPPYGQPQYGQQPGQYWQPGQPLYGPPSQSQYGQSPYGQPPYGQPGQAPYGQPGAPWAAPSGPGGQRPKGSKNTLVALIIAGVVVLAAIGVALFVLLGGKDDTTTNASSRTTSSSPSNTGDGIPPATVPPVGLGDDPILDQYAQSCYDGDMDACDTLYDDSEFGSTYETYGGTCAGRQPISESDAVYCADAFPA
jgi:hypothetical protein